MSLNKTYPRVNERGIVSKYIIYIFMANVSVYMVGYTVYKPFPGCIENPIGLCS